MFIAAKLFAFVTQPLAWVALLMFAALLLTGTRPSFSKRLGWSALALLLTLGWEPLPDALLRRLEAQYPPFAANASVQTFVGVVVLGGALESGYVWTVSGQSALNDAAERMTEVLPLLRKNPALRVLFSGGEGELFASDMSEAQRARIFFDSQGIDTTKMLFESTSRTTHENAVLSKSLQGVDPSRPWLLLTSAWHQPRAMAAFRSAGWNVTAYPVDFRSGLYTPWSCYSLNQGVNKWCLALHEIVGMLAYRLTGRA